MSGVDPRGFSGHACYNKLESTQLVGFLQSNYQFNLLY